MSAPTINTRRISPADLDYMLGATDKAPKVPLKPVEIQPQLPSPSTAPLGPRELFSGRESSKVAAKSPDGTTHQYNPISCDNPVEFSKIFSPEQPLETWQQQELLRLAGFTHGTLEGPHVEATSENPLYYNFCANNGAGKDQVIIARLAAWACATQIETKFYITTASHEQLKRQTQPQIDKFCRQINDFLGEEVFEIVEFHVKIPRTGSEIILRVTDKASLVEGQHPNLGAKLWIVLNETKSLADDIIAAHLRFSGYSNWIEISSPGSCEGHFFRTSQGADTFYPAPLELNKRYFRKVSAYECPWISKAHIDQMRKLHGESSLLFRSSILAEFTSIDSLALIPQESTIYPPPKVFLFDSTKRAGLDFALGGDECVYDIWLGNQRAARYSIYASQYSELIDKVIAITDKEGLDHNQVNADGGGFGKILLQMLRDKGYEFNTVRNESRAADPKNNLNRGVELYNKVKRLIEEKLLILPHDDTKCMMQLVTRRYTYKNGKMKLEPKADHKSRGNTSPDRADAFVLAWAQVSLSDFIDAFRGEEYKAAQPELTLLDYERLLDERRASKAQKQSNALVSEATAGQKSASFQDMIDRARTRPILA